VDLKIKTKKKLKKQKKEENIHFIKDCNSNCHPDAYQRHWKNFDFVSSQLDLHCSFRKTQVDDGCDDLACFYSQLDTSSSQSRRKANQVHMTADMAALAIDSSDGKREPDAEVENLVVVVVMSCKATSDDDRIKLR
jgi:hypothetical protein